MGRAGSNYSPLTSLWFNPVLMSDSRALLDIQLVGVSAFAHNNYAYLEGGQLNSQSLNSGDVRYGFRSQTKRIAIHADQRVYGPSVSFKIRKTFFALTTAYRTVASVRGISSEFVDIATDGLQREELFGRTFSMDRLRIGASSYAEFGIAAAGIYNSSGKDVFSFGGHIRRLLPVGGASVVLDDARFTVIDSTDMLLENLQASFGFSDFEQLANEGFGFHGGGWGIDLGWSWKRAYKGPVSDYTPFDPGSSCKWCDYQWKLSVGILDLGYISYDPPFFRGEITSADTASWQGYSGYNPESAEDVEQTFEELFGVERGSTKYRTMLPTAATFQFDLHLKDGFYLQSAAVIAVPWTKGFGIQRGSSIGVIPRFETKRFEAAVPFTVAAMQRPSIGLMLRLNSVIIGSDNLLGLLGRNVYGADVYLHLKYSVFKHPKCRSTKGRTSRGGSSRKRGHVACPNW